MNTKDWPTKKLGEVAELEKGKMLPNSLVNEGGATPYIVINDLRTGEYSRFTKYTGGTVCEPSDSLIVWDGANAGTVGGGLRGFVGSTITKISPKEEVNPKFLKYFLASGFKNFNKWTHGAAVPHLNKDYVLNYKVPIPPMKAQQKIVERLDAIRKAQELNEKQISLASELFQSLLNRELKPRKDWEIGRLGEIVKDITNGFASRPVGENKGISQIRPHNIGSDGNETLDGIKFVPKTIKNLEKYFLKEGDVLFNNTNSIELVGKTAYVSQDYKIVFSNHITRIRVKENIIISYFLSSFLNYIYHLGKFRSLCTPWVNQAGVNNVMLKRLKIPLPSLKTQRRIVKKLSAVQEYKKKLLKQKELLQELFESTLDRAMKGKLVK